MPLPAKVYLQKIFVLDMMIASNKEKVKSYKEAATNKISKLSENKIQTSRSKEKMADAVCMYSDIEKVIKLQVRKKQEIIDTISLLNPYESIVLYKCYVDNMSLKEIAQEISRSYSWVSKRHNAGIKKIQKILDEREKAGD